MLLRFWGVRTNVLHVFIGASGWPHGLNECPVQVWRAVRLVRLHPGWVQNRREALDVKRFGQASKGHQTCDCVNDTSVGRSNANDERKAIQGIWVPPPAEAWFRVCGLLDSDANVLTFMASL